MEIVQLEAFRQLKDRLLSAPILCYFDRSRSTKLETDSSNRVLGGVLSQQ